MDKASPSISYQYGHISVIPNITSISNTEFMKFEKPKERAFDATAQIKDAQKKEQAKKIYDAFRSKYSNNTEFSDEMTKLCEAFYDMLYLRCKDEFDKMLHDAEQMADQIQQLANNEGDSDA